MPEEAKNNSCLEANNDENAAPSATSVPEAVKDRETNPFCKLKTYQRLLSALQQTIRQWNSDVSAEYKKNHEANDQSSAPVLPASDPISNQNTESWQMTLYSPNAAGLWSLLLSVVFGSWCVWQNYKIIGDEKAAARSKIWTFSLLALIIISVFLPDDIARYSAVPLLIVWYFAEQRTQVKYLEEKKIIYTKKPWRKTVITAMILMVMFFGIAAVLSSCLSAPYEDAVIQTTTKIVSWRTNNMRCVKITNVKSLGHNRYRAKAVLRNEAGVTGFMDITYEVVDDSVVVEADVHNIIYRYQ